jgi:hypothetical protein
MDGVIRVDNYWCHSAILSTRPKEAPIPVSPTVSEAVSNGRQDEPPTGNTLVTPPTDNTQTTDSPRADDHITIQEIVENSGIRHKKFDPRARLNELKRNAERKIGPEFAAKLRSRARAAMRASKALMNNENINKQDSDENVIDGSQKSIKDQGSGAEASSEHTKENCPPKILAVDLPGMSFITLFCDDQKVRRYRIK